jgi:hypothetical protein
MPETESSHRIRPVERTFSRDRSRFHCWLAISRMASLASYLLRLNLNLNIKRAREKICKSLGHIFLRPVRYPAVAPLD